MPEEKLDLDERYFANHKFQEAFAIPEYELAARKLDGDEKAFLWATNTITLLSPALWFLGYQVHQGTVNNQTSTSDHTDLSSSIHNTFCRLHHYGHNLCGKSKDKSRPWRTKDNYSTPRTRS